MLKLLLCCINFYLYIAGGYVFAEIWKEDFSNGIRVTIDTNSDQPLAIGGKGWIQADIEYPAAYKLDIDAIKENFWGVYRQGSEHKLRFLNESITNNASHGNLTTQIKYEFSCLKQGLYPVGFFILKFASQGDLGPVIKATTPIFKFLIIEEVAPLQQTYPSLFNIKSKYVLLIQGSIIIVTGLICYALFVTFLRKKSVRLREITLIQLHALQKEIKIHNYRTIYLAIVNLFIKCIKEEGALNYTGLSTPEILHFWFKSQTIPPISKTQFEEWLQQLEQVLFSTYQPNISQIDQLFEITQHLIQVGIKNDTAIDVKG
ncbi:MAG: hypothetical protein K0S74_1095 [Chlamydiales bacterium]|jgi:hypothetical protein|nr:hypothetical protein [Chlamydiales bacterium]